MVPMQDASLAIKRLDEIKSLGLRGIEIGSHINGIPLGDARLHEVYAAAEQAGLMVMVHPLHPLGSTAWADDRTRRGCGISARNCVCRGIADDQRCPERFPKLRILLSHGGGALPWILPRLRHARTIGPPLDSLFPRDPGEMAKSFYYDTILYDDVALDYLVAKVGKDDW